MEFSRCTRAGNPPCIETPAFETAGLSKLNSVRKSNVEVDVLLGESDSPTAEAIQGSDAYRNEFPVSLERR